MAVLDHRPVGRAVNEPVAAAHQVAVAEPGPQPQRRGRHAVGEGAQEVGGTGRHRAAHELLRHDRRVVLVVVAHHVGLPERVDVTGEERRVLHALVEEEPGEHVALPLVPVPRVGVQVEPGVLRQVRLGVAHHGLVQVEDPDRADHHLVADQLPRHAVVLRRAQSVEQPGPLCLAQDRPVDSRHLCGGTVDGQRQRELAAVRVHVAVLAGVEERQVDQVPPPDPAVGLGAVDRPHRLVLEPRPVGRSRTLRVLEDRDPVVVVHELVVVPDRQEGVPGVGVEDVGVGPVEAVLGPVGGQVGGRTHGVAAHVGERHVPARLVDVVAQVHDRVDVLLRDAAPRRVVARREVLARRDGQPDPAALVARGGRRLGPAGAAGPTVDHEPVEVRAARGKALGEHLDGPVGLPRRRAGALGHDLGERGVGRHLPRHVDGPASGCRRHPGPEDRRGGVVDPREHTAVEDGVERGRHRHRTAGRHRAARDPLGRGQTCRTERACLQEGPSVHLAPPTSWNFARPAPAGPGQGTTRDPAVSARSL